MRDVLNHPPSFERVQLPNCVGVDHRLKSVLFFNHNGRIVSETI